MLPDKSYIKTRFTYDIKRKFIWKVIANYIDELIPKSESILELGCGYCDWINNSNSSSKFAIDYIGQYKKYANLDVEFFQGNCTEISKITNKKFDRIQMSNLLEHLDLNSILLTIKSIKSHLKKNGYVVIIQPNYFYSYRKYFDDYTHKSIWTHISLADFMESNNFKVIHVEKRFLPFSVKSKLSFGYKLIRIYLKLPIRPFAGQMLLVLKLVD